MFKMRRIKGTVSNVSVPTFWSGFVQLACKFGVVIRGGQRIAASGQFRVAFVVTSRDMSRHCKLTETRPNQFVLLVT